MHNPNLVHEKSPVLKPVHPRSNTAYARNPNNSDDEDNESNLMPEPLNCKESQFKEYLTIMFKR